MLKGPCGIEKVAEAMTRISDSSDEIAFYIAELCFELKYAKLKEHEESLKIKKVRTELDKLIHELWEKHCRSINRKNTVGEYVNRLGEKVTV
jgi:hypothetical protein